MQKDCGTPKYRRIYILFDEFWPSMFLKIFTKRRQGATWGGSWEPDRPHAEIIAGLPPGRRYFQPLGAERLEVLLVRRHHFHQPSYQNGSTMRPTRR